MTKRLRNDDGSMLMAMMMALMVLSLLAVMTATVYSSHSKTRVTRAQAVSAQVVSAATSDVMMAGNLGKFTGWETTGAGQTSTGTYSWTATRRTDNPALADVTITTTSVGTTRTYEGVMEEVPVLDASRQSDGTVRYRARTDTTTSVVVWQVKAVPVLVS